MVADYAVRLSRTFEELREFFDRLEANNIKYIVYEHTADTDVARTHIHALLLSVAHSTDTLKNWVKKALDVTDYPKTDWSFKLANADYDRYVTYMSKGELEPLRNTAISNERVIQARNAWEQPTSKTSTKCEKSDVVVVSVQRKTKNELMEEVSIKLRKELGNMMPSDKEIIRAVCDVLRHNRVITNVYKLADYVDSYKMWYHGTEFADIVEKYYLHSRYR